MSILSRYREWSSSSLVPLNTTIELTYRCNERCSHCYLATYDDNADGRPPLKLVEWKKILDQIADAGGLMLTLIGGEAMMHPQFWDISEYAAEKNFALILITNGLLINPPVAEKMAQLGFYQVAISIYSFYPEIHDKMTQRKGSHAKTIRAIELLHERGIDIKLNCLLTQDNIDTCFDLENWAVERQLQVQFDPMVTPKTDGSLDSTLKRATPEQLFHYYSQLKNKGRGPAPIDSGTPEDPVCNAGRGKCAVNAYGDLLTCLEIRKSLGNLREYSFNDLWHSANAEAIRAYRNMDLKFESQCGDGSFCDHCPGMAGAEVGDPMAPVPYLMELAQIKRRVFERN